jgi:hypothetical protein
VNRERNPMDERVARAAASCCGVNLALCWVGVRGCGLGSFSADCEAGPFQGRTESEIS